MDVIPEEPVYLSQKGNEGYATPSFKSRNNFVHILDATYIYDVFELMITIMITIKRMISQENVKIVK